VADVWFYNDSTDTTKSADEWKTVLVCGLRKGGKTYFALDITDTLNPKYLWEFPKSSDAATLALVGQSWSEPGIGRVKVEVGGELYERWVAFIGGGFDRSEKPDKDATVGGAFFVVDIKTGDIIWQYSSGHHAIPAPPTAVDTNLDGYVDKVYIGDFGGQMWVFDVSFDEASKKSNSLWADKAKILFKASSGVLEKHNIYYQPAVAFDKYRIPWVYFGTGDRENPKGWGSTPERFYAVRDDGSGSYPRAEGDLSNVTTNPLTFTPDPTKKGWYIKLDKSGRLLEKVLAKPAVFNRLLYFDTYSYTPTANLCTAGGISKEYVVEFLSGGGALTVDDLSDLSGPTSSRSQQIGIGAPSNPVITVNNKGKASIIVGNTSGQIYSAPAFSPTTNKAIMYWREVIP
jgi:type IV pilus assembly protein PilY1